MATPEPDTREHRNQAHDQDAVDDQTESMSESSNGNGEARVASDGNTSENTSRLPPDTTSLPGQSQDETCSDLDRDLGPEASSLTHQHGRSESKYGAVTSPNSRITTPLIEGGVASPPGFAFSNPGRKTLELGGNRPGLHQVTQVDESSAVRDASSPENGVRQIDAPAPTCPPSSNEALSGSHARNETPQESDIMSDDHSMRDRSLPSDSVQYQVDEQIYQEASMSDSPERHSSPMPRSEDVIYIGATTHQHVVHSLTDPDVGKKGSPAVQPEPQQHVHFSSLTRKPLPGGSLGCSANRRPSSQSHGMVSTRSSSMRNVDRRPAAQAHVVTNNRASNSAVTTNGIQELLEVVEYKFKQNEQRLREAFLNDSNKARLELQQLWEENEDLRSQIAVFEDRCNRSDAAIDKYKSQIGKAKSFQKFLDGLGSDLKTLKGSYDAEKHTFARRIEISEAEILRLESRLSGKDKFADMLAHSKTSLEKLLETRGFELQSVVQHRDLLRGQLEDRIGQLVEERDTRLRLEQVVAELRVSERSSLTASIEQCARMLTSKAEGLSRQDNELAVDIASLHNDVGLLTKRPVVTSNDITTITKELQDLGSRVTQSLSAEAATNTDVIDISYAVQGIFHSEIQTLHQGLDRLELVSKQTASNTLTQITSHVELQSTADRLKGTEVELEAAKQSEATLRTALTKSNDRILELEAAPSPASNASTKQHTTKEVESKINEAVAEARTQLASNANTFIAQEKARYCNELKKVNNELYRSSEELKARKQDITKLQSQLDDMRASISATASHGPAVQLSKMTDRFRELEKKYQAVQNEADGKRSLEARLNATLAERNLAQGKISACNSKLTTLSQEIEHCNVALLQVRTAEEDAQKKLEELRAQSQANVDDLCRKLAQTEEKTRYAEAGLAQMKSSAEETITNEQEKHRKQQEALQQRLDEAQSELQMRTSEAENTRAFTERTIKQQQAAWQRSNADLETKAANYKAMLEEKSRVLDSAQEEHDSLRLQVAKLQTEVDQHQQTETERCSREDDSNVVIEDLRGQLDAAQTELLEMQAVQQRYLREKGERSSREAKAKSSLEILRSNHESAKALIVQLQERETQRENGDVKHKQDEIAKTRELDNLRNERDVAQAALKELQAARVTAGFQMREDARNDHKAAPDPEEQLLRPDSVAPSPSSLAPKQRRKVDRNTNTVVESESKSSRTVAQHTRLGSLSGQEQVFIPTQPVLDITRNLVSQDEMLDVASSQPEKGREIPLVSSMQDYAESERSKLRANMESSKPFVRSLNFSGEPLTVSRETHVDRASNSAMAQTTLSSDFKIYEDSQIPFDDGLDEESSIRANFTFRKPFPLPNSGSKRLSRTVSDKSSRETRRTPEAAGSGVYSQVMRTPDPKYPYGSSPEFMNPPSTKTKRRCSGNAPNTPGYTEPLAPHRPSTPLPDPRIAAKPRTSKRKASGDSQQDTDSSVKKRLVAQTTTRSKSKLKSDDSFIGRSSQSVKDLPRIDDLNAGRIASQSHSSHMRTSAGSKRVTRNQKGTKDDAYKARFSQELRHR